ncbi:hypothetical protein [Chitinilyticum aquatile]|uniref:hypothetical protein n=1 Tax=Chitinilyticum aquatile TaxID=362520 RepID=UPI0004084C08|nr:hypothetical protein [Chitinilyticum aquatile]
MPELSRTDVLILLALAAGSLAVWLATPARPASSSEPPAVPGVIEPACGSAMHYRSGRAECAGWLA